jgi:phosphatidylinositol alpha-mannosyltransferase
MRIALVSPYSWTYPGGVMRHVESLYERLADQGHDVTIFAPHDPDDRTSSVLHRGHAPEPRSLPDHVVSLGRTIGIPANGAVSNLAITPYAATTLRRELRSGRFDVAHLHEPMAPIPCWDALMSAEVPLVGTFHCYSENWVSNNLGGGFLGAKRRLNRLAVRIAVSEAAAWTGRRYYGGRYRIIPNGVDLPATRATAKAPGDELRIAFVGQSVERKGLPVLLRAFEALREHVPAHLTIVGADTEQVSPMLLDHTGIEALGKVSDAEKSRVLRESDVLCAPSLGGESFGMVLTEAFAQGTPVVASDIAGYRDVVRHGRDGLLVPRGDAHALAESLRDLYHAPQHRTDMSVQAAQRAERFSWDHVAEEVAEAYEDAVAAPAPVGARRRFAVSRGLVPADGAPRERARRMPTLEPVPGGSRARVTGMAKRAAFILAALLGVVLAGLALRRIGVDNIGHTLLRSSPTYILFGLGLMCLSMIARAVAWLAILRAAFDDVRPRLADAVQGTLIGVLMSATLPARLGEPSRALIVARRTGRPREHLPVVLGTLVSQTLLNLVALVILGIVMFKTVGLFDGHQRELVLFTVAPVAVLLGVLITPALLRRGKPSRFKRVSAFLTQARDAMWRVRQGLRVFGKPRFGVVAFVAQMTAWGIQWLSCYVLLVALGLDHHGAGMGAAAAVLFAVNVTAVLPVTPSNLGVFQAACVAVLAGGYGISHADALGYGIILQAVELTTAVIMGMPALVKEGVSWRDVRLRALHTAPVQLQPRESRERRGAVNVEA